MRFEMLKKYCNFVSAIFAAVFVFSVIFSVCSCKTTPKAPEKEKSTPVKKSPEVIFVEKLQAALEKGTVDDALAVFDKMPKQFESNYDIILIRASLFVSAKRYDEARADVDILEKLDPGNANTLVIKTMIAKSTGNQKEKSKLLKEIVAADPNNSDAYVEMANDQMLGKRYKLASAYINSFISGIT